MSNIDRDLRKILAIDSVLGDEYAKPTELTYNTYNYYYYNLLILALSRAKWRLPETCSSRFFELSMLSDGMAIFVLDNVDRTYKTLRVNANGRYNDYGEPIRRVAYGFNGSIFPVTERDSVLVYNNDLWRGILGDLRMFAGRMAQQDRTIDINVYNQRHPVIAYGSQEQRLTFVNLFKSIATGLPFIQLKDKFNKDAVSTLDISSQYVSDKIYEMKVKIWNEALQYLGFANMSINKTERMIQDEVQRSMGGALAFRTSFLKTRIEGAEKINKLFDDDLASVEWNSESDVLAQKIGGEMFGTIYDATRDISTQPTGGGY